MKGKLKCCPCGTIPDKLCLTQDDMKRAYASGYCCGEWNIEFRTNYKKLDSDECMGLAVDAWNRTERGEWK